VSILNELYNVYFDINHIFNQVNYVLFSYSTILDCVVDDEGQNIEHNNIFAQVGLIKVDNCLPNSFGEKIEQKQCYIYPKSVRSEMEKC